MSRALTSLNVADAEVNLPEGVRVRVELLEEWLLTPTRQDVSACIPIRENTLTQ